MKSSDYPILRILQKIENNIVIIMFIVMVLAAFAQVVNRNIIGAGIPWFEELARFCMIYVTLIATEIGIRDGSQVMITAVADHLPPAAGHTLRIINKIIVIVFSVIVCVFSVPILKTQIDSQQVSAGLHLSMAVPYFSLTISFGLIVIIQCATVVTMIVRFQEFTSRGAFGEAAS
jgi:TRAP-type C4-dicarboxylate transport system permease small subunit